MKYLVNFLFIFSFSSAMELKKTILQESSIIPLKALVAHEIFYNEKLRKKAPLILSQDCKTLVYNIEFFIQDYLNSYIITRENKKNLEKSNELNKPVLHKYDDVIIRWPSDARQILIAAIYDKRFDIIDLFKKKFPIEERFQMYNKLYEWNPGSIKVITKSLFSFNFIPLDDKFYSWPILMKVLNTSSSLVKFLLKKGADPNARDDRTGDTALIMAVSKNYKRSEYLPVIQQLFAFGANINLQNDLKESALTVALYNQNTVFLKLLLEHNPDLEIIIKGKKLWDYAKELNNQEILRLLRIKFDELQEAK